jgi:hypothetical protein
MTKEGNLNFRNGTYFIDKVFDGGNHDLDHLPLTRTIQWIRGENNIYLLVFVYLTANNSVLMIYKNFVKLQEIIINISYRDFDKIQMDNWGNMMYMVDGIHQPKILMVDYNGAFILVNVEFDEPAWDSENVTNLFLTASSSSGNITITANQSFFKLEDVGRYLKFRYTGTNNTGYVLVTGFNSTVSVSASVKVNLPILSTDYWSWSIIPNSVLFYQGRLFYFSNDRIVASRTQDNNGIQRFDDFTLGADPTNALNLTNTIFKTPILWAKDTNKILFVGTSTNIFKVASTNTDGFLAPDNLPIINPIANEGSKRIIPLQENNNIFYISIVGIINDNGSRLNSIVYDFMSESYKVNNINLLNDEINREGIIQFSYIRGFDDILYCLKNNGEISGLVYNVEQQINGWFRLTTSNFDRQRGKNSDDGFIESIATLRQDDGSEVLVMTVRRKEYDENGDYTVNRYLEYLSHPSKKINRMEFFSNNEEYDTREYNYYSYQSQLNNNYMDCASVYNGLQNKSLTLSQREVGEAIATITDGTFTDNDIDKKIFEDFGYNLEDGQALILEVIDPNNLRINIQKPFTKTNLDNFILSINKTTLPTIFRNKTVCTIVDGGRGQEYTIANDCVLNLQYPAKYLIVGFKYLGLVKTVNLNVISETGNTSDLKKHVKKVDLYFYNTIGCKVGTNLYDLAELYIGVGRETGKPPYPLNSIKTLALNDSPDEEKEIYIVKDDYCGCCVQLMNVHVNS